MRNGFCRVPIAARDALDEIRHRYVEGLRAATGERGADLDDETYLNRFHELVDMTKLNDARVGVIREHGSSESVRHGIFRAVEPALLELVGAEIAMQRHVNLVLQLPGDTENLLYLHTDAWSGCSPYEIVAWIPLVSVHGTKSMYICPRDKGKAHLEALRAARGEVASAEALFARVEKDVEPVTLSYGEALLFSTTLLHGARKNETNETRAILNVRFKGLFTPYGTKTLGETFLPVSYRPASEVGLAYESDFGMVRG